MFKVHAGSQGSTKEKWWGRSLNLAPWNIHHDIPLIEHLPTENWTISWFYSSFYIGCKSEAKFNCLQMNCFKL